MFYQLDTQLYIQLCYTKKDLSLIRITECTVVIVFRALYS